MKMIGNRLKATMETDGYVVPQSCAEFEETWGFEIDSTPPDEKWYLLIKKGPNYWSLFSISSRCFSFTLL